MKFEVGWSFWRQVKPCFYGCLNSAHQVFDSLSSIFFQVGLLIVDRVGVICFWVFSL
ncbi:hypothetical protein Hanom_Chr05g00398371 [Helianthus anomalus]